MSQEIYTKEEHYQDWKADNILYLKKEFLAENYNKSLVAVSEDEFLDNKYDEFEAYCRQEFKDRG